MSGGTTPSHALHHEEGRADRLGVELQPQGAGHGHARCALPPGAGPGTGARGRRRGRPARLRGRGRDGPRRPGSPWPRSTRRRGRARCTRRAASRSTCRWTRGRRARRPRGRAPASPTSAPAVGAARRGRVSRSGVAAPLRPPPWAAGAPTALGIGHVAAGRDRLPAGEPRGLVAAEGPVLEHAPALGPVARGPGHVVDHTEGDPTGDGGVAHVDDDALGRSRGPATARGTSRGRRRSRGRS